MEIIRDAGSRYRSCMWMGVVHVQLVIFILQMIKSRRKIKFQDDDEESMLDQAFDVEKNSRLGCQIEYTDEMMDLLLK